MEPANLGASAGAQGGSSSHRGGEQGAIGVQRIRYALAAALTADAAGVVGSIIGVKLYFMAMGI